MGIIFLFFVLPVLGFTVIQQNLLIDVVEKLRVTQCLIETSDKSRKSELMLVKEMSRTNVASNIWPHEKITKYLEEVTENFVPRPEYFSTRLTLNVISLRTLKKIFPAKNNLQISSTSEDDLKSYTLSWYKWLVFWDDTDIPVSSVAFVPYDCLVLIVYQRSTTESYQINMAYNIKNKSYEFTWGLWNDGRLDVNTTGTSFRPLSGVSFSRQYYHPHSYGLFGRILAPNQEIVEEINKLLNMTVILLHLTDPNFHKFEMTDSATMFSAHSHTGNVGPIMELKMNMFIKRLGENALDNYFIHPFHRNVWLVIACWIFIASLAVIITQFKGADKSGQKYLESVCAILEAFCCQGGSWEDGTLPGRLLRLSTWVTACVVVPAYTAVIISFMTARQPYIPFKDITGFAADGRYVLSGDRGMAPIYVLANDKETQAIVAKFMVSDEEKPYSFMEATEKICFNRHAYVGYNQLIRAVPAPCEIMSVEKTLGTLHSSLTLKLYSPLRRVFQKQVARFWSNGMINRFRSIIDEVPQVWDTQAAVPVELDLVRDVFVIIIYGVPTAIFACLLEILWSLRHNLRRLSFKGRFKGKK